MKSCFLRKLKIKLINFLGEKTAFQIQLRLIRIKQKRRLKKIKKKKTLKICFFLIMDSVWKYDELYRLLKNDNRFELTILVCPYIVYGEENMEYELNKTFLTFQKRGYHVIKSLNQDGTWVDVKKDLRPDIIFFTNPHKLTLSQYCIENFKDFLTCYVPYNFGNSHLLKMFHDQDFHNYLWKLFAETEIHKNYSNEIARNKGKNVIVTGFPGTDVFLENKTEGNKADNIKSGIWKNKEAKKIIWAPHHTIDDNKSFISFSSFLLYYNFMLELLNLYDGKIEMIFKPHPLLKIKLYEFKDWGKQRTDEYFEKWKTHKYGGLNESDYVDLFLTSDAMIHDSGSFLIEYLYTEKPVLRTDRDDTITDRLNSFGKMAYNVHYIAKNEKEILNFIETVIIKGKDNLKNERIKFKKNYLIPPNGISASENIYNYLVSVLK